MDQLEEFGLAVKAEPIEGERSNEQDENSVENHGNSWGFTEIYPVVNIQKAIENGPVIVDLPIKNCDFPIC